MSDIEYYYITVSIPISRKNVWEASDYLENKFQKYASGSGCGMGQRFLGFIVFTPKRAKQIKQNLEKQLVKFRLKACSIVSIEEVLEES